MAPPAAGGSPTYLPGPEHRFTIAVGAPNAASGTVPVTISNCNCSTATSSPTPAPTSHFGDADFIPGACVHADGSPVAPPYGMTGSAATECADEGMWAIATAEECSAACFYVSFGKHYRAGSWDYQPTGCFRMNGVTGWLGNCHWNTDQDPVNRDYDDDTAGSRLVCTDRQAAAGSRRHPDPAFPAASCGAWCADATENPGATGCEYVFEGPDSLVSDRGNGCFAVFDEALAGAAADDGGGAGPSKFCWVLPPATPSPTPAPTADCNGEPETARCWGVRKYWGADRPAI